MKVKVDIINIYIMMHSHVWYCAKFDDFNSFRGIACEGQTHGLTWGHLLMAHFSVA